MTLFKEKKSKFYGYAFPLSNEETLKTHLEKIRKEHHTASHFCYAYQIGIENTTFRTNDDGEPNNSAGLPIYGQIQSFGITNVLVVVVRYFGGVKLGVGGLAQAYKTAARLTLEQCQIVTRTLKITFLVSFPYEEINRVMRIIKENRLKILDQNLQIDCKIKLSVRKRDAATVFRLFNTSQKIQIAKI
ncbi:IMPACT family protein [Aestuariivivens sediminicola]|uniref:IMPACT family protein n=1 Tax=Aestuariivivens sediminicola TaxID=2913560 RepID=UPI001F584004|nr:YigZ family protein [Aestuariivivens sediminicola]